MTPIATLAIPHAYRNLILHRIALGLLAISLLGASGCNSFRNKDKSEDDNETGENAGDSSFVQKCRELADSNSGVVIGKNGWLFDVPELSQIAQTADIPAQAESKVISCVADYHHQLRKVGIELVVVPIPQKAMIYADELDAQRSGRLDDYLQSLYKKLRSKGVNVVDVTPDLHRARKSPQGVMYPVTANHLSPKGAEVVAGAIVEEIKNRPWAKGLNPDPNLFASSMQITLLGNLAGYVRDENARQAIQPEALPMRAIGKRTANGSVIPAARSSDGHILLITSDQAGLAYGVPGTPAGYDADLRGSLADQLIYELGVPVDVYSHPSSGANTARVRLLRESMTKPALLSKTVAIIWAFSANEFTQAGWREVPLNLELRQSDDAMVN